MKILFMHTNIPGQYKHLARHFGAEKGNEVVFLTHPKNVDVPGVHRIEFKVTRDAAPETHRYLIPFERAILASQETWRVLKKLKESGFVPDVICGHLGWGNGIYVKDIFPDTPILSFYEFYYNARGGDVNFLPGEQTTPDEAGRIRTKNALHLFNLTDSDWGICPTFFQLSQHPDIFHRKISVIHDGVDTEAVTPGTGKSVTLPNGVTLTPEDEVITYISRNFEPYRGFPEFMRAAELILKQRPKAHIIMVGQDGVSYGKKAPHPFKSYREMMMKEVNLDMSRFHFLGYLPYEEMVKVMQVSSAHIYLTVPFVLSWSMMEAMSAGCLVIGSRTAPVQEVINDGENGLLVDFFNHEDIADKVNQVFAHKNRFKDLRVEARRTVEDRYALKKLLPLHINLVKDLAAGQLPPKTSAEIIEFNKSHFRPDTVAIQKL